MTARKKDKSETSEVPVKARTGGSYNITRKAAWTVLVAGLMITIAATLYMKSNVERTAERDFNFRCDEIQNVIADRIDDYVHILVSGAALFDASEEVTREKWRIFNKQHKIEKQLPGMQGIGFSLLIPPAELSRHIRKIRSEGFPEYNVKPAGDREIYSSIIYLEPFSDRNLRAFGYDMFSEPVRRTAMERARDTDSAALSGKVVLVQETDEKVQAGTLIYVPVYRKGMPTGTVEQRRAAIYGWVYSPYRMNDLLRGVLAGGNLEKAERLHLEIFDGTQTSPQSLLYEFHAPENGRLRPSVLFTRQIPLVFNGHSWSLRFTEIGGGLFTAEYTKVWLILGGGALITLLLFTLILVLLNTRAAAQLMAEELTADLREERQRMANIIQGTNVGTWEWNVQTGDAILNDIWAEIIGYTLAELTPTSISKWEELVHPDDIKYSRELLKRHFSGEIPFYDCEYRMKHKDGHWVWVQDCGQLITRTDAGKPLMMSGTHADVTARKLVEETFARMSREWQRTFDSMGEAVWILDKNHLLLRSNKAAEHYFHRPCEAMVGRHCWEIVHGTTQATPECPTMRVRKSLHHENQEIQVGEEWFDIAVDPILDADGQFDGVVHIVTNITARKKAEAALISSETRFRTIIDASPVPMALNDDEQRITFLNQAFIKTFGYTLEDIPTLAQWWPKAYPDPEYRQQVADDWQALLEQANRSGEAFSPLEISVRCKNGTTKTMLVSATSFSNSHGRNHLVILYDITERKRAEEEKLNLESQLRQSQKMEAVGQLAGGISHDFNNLLSVISGYSQILLMNPDLADNIRLLVEEINTAAERAAGLTRQLLLFSRREQLESKIINLDTVISGIEKMLRRLIKADIIVTRNIRPDLWRIKADPGSIEQVIMNLVINASDAMPDGGTLTIETENLKIDESSRLGHNPDLKPGLYVVLSVSDTGCGMEDYVRERMFDPFFTTKEAGKGTGLGLATVYGIVKQSDAHIDVQSELEKGTRFRIYFPQAVNEEAADAEQQRMASIPSGNETILLADDEESMRMMLQNFLQSIGYAVLPACNGKEALELAEKHKNKIHLLLTDIVMPVMNGFELAKQIRNSAPEIKLLFMSGYDNPTKTDKMIWTSGNSIQKPIDLPALAVKLREILDAVSSEGESGIGNR